MSNFSRMDEQPIIDLQSDHYFMGEALRQATRAYEAEECPIGAVIVRDRTVLSTGYKPQEYLVRKLFGDGVADRVGPIWGFGDGLELRNMYARTKQPGLWFIAGSLAQCRINSKYLALQIKAIEEGMLGPT